MCKIENFMNTQIVPTEFLEFYRKKQPLTLEKHIARFKRKPQDVDNVEYSIAEAAVYSSMIEGNPIDFDLYVKIRFAEVPETKQFHEIQELIQAYEFAMNHRLTQTNFYTAHGILTKTLIEQKEGRGKIRHKEVGVFSGRRRIYSAIPASNVEAEMGKLFADIEILINSDLSISEAFYFASMVSLVFVHIHPFVDGNGRSARLLEKWVLAQKIGSVAWIIPIEKLYQTRIRKYYENINLGSDYEHVNYKLSMPFLLMLPMALTAKY